MGFLTVCEFDEVGLLGGYLLLNGGGRPLEFHCTTPVKPNRAQEILYGTSIRPYLYGDVIGKALLEKSPSQPKFVCTDCHDAMSVRPFAASPVAFISSDVQADSFPLGEWQATVSAAHRQDKQLIADEWQTHFQQLDLCEPFSRIREALEEAQNSRKAA